MNRTEAFFESINRCDASDELKNAMKHSYIVLHESEILDEGVKDIAKAGIRKFGKLAAAGALAFGAANANAAPAKASVPVGGNTTTVSSHTYHNLWQNQKFQDRVDEIINKLVAEKEAAGKPYSYDILQNKAWNLALAELKDGKIK